jgi:tetratricopeptide (TPR) repeat protein
LAIKDFTKLIQSDSTNAGAFAFRGYSYGYLDKNKEAITDFNKAIELDSDNLFSYYRRGMCKANLEDYQLAMDDYDFILNYKGERRAEFNDWATVYSEKANCLNELNRPEEALLLINESLKLDESLWFSWLIRGLIYYKMEEFQKCIVDMDHVISILELSESYYYRGLAKIKLGKKTEGCSDLSKAGELGAKKAYNVIKENCR